MKTEQSAGVVVFYTKNNCTEYLLLHYPAGHWDFAKGHIEKGESKIEAAERELLEETGLQSTIIKGFEHAFDYFLKGYDTDEKIHKTVYFFVGEVTTQQVNLSYEHRAYQWLPLNQALEKLTYQNARVLLKKVDDFLKDKCDDQKSKKCGACCCK